MRLLQASSILMDSPKVLDAPRKLQQGLRVLINKFPTTHLKLLMERKCTGSLDPSQNPLYVLVRRT